MGDFLRFLATAECDLDLPSVEMLFKSVDASFAIHAETAEPHIGELLYQSESLGEVEINYPGEVVYDEDIGEMLEILEDVEEDQKPRVLSLIRTAKLMVALQLTEEGHEAYDRIDPFWDALFAHCDGLLQVDDEGYYDRDGLILPLS